MLPQNLTAVSRPQRLRGRRLIGILRQAYEAKDHRPENPVSCLPWPAGERSCRRARSNPLSDPAPSKELERGQARARRRPALQWGFKYGPEPLSLLAGGDGVPFKSNHQSSESARFSTPCSAPPRKMLTRARERPRLARLSGQPASADKGSAGRVPPRPWDQFKLDALRSYPTLEQSPPPP